MHAIKSVRKYLQSHPDSADAAVLRRLIAALGEEREFKLAELYGLEREAFELAMELLSDWRLDRYYAARIKLFDVVLGSEPDLGATGEKPLA
ncbi:MAG: hypothetical protein ACM3ZD_03195 [Betaproteobacteria bacterium]